MNVPGLPKPLECLLRGLLEENRLSSWTSEWTDGDVNVTIKFSPLTKKPQVNAQQPASIPVTGKLVDTTGHYDSSSDSDDNTLISRGKASLSVTSNCEEGTAGKPRRYHLLELANSPPSCTNELHNAFPNPSNAHCMMEGTMMNEEKRVRGMTPSVSSSSEEAMQEKESGQKVRSYREINMREFGNTYCSTSGENSSPEGYDEVDNMPLKIYNETNASDTADKFDATRLVDISE